jgi:SAM-dependent methyltransferase
MRAMGIYAYPAVYAALVKPERRVIDAVRGWVRHHLGRDAKAVLDPACGPAKWLEPFAARGVRLAGVDNEPGMVERARHVLVGHDAEIVLGDMRELPLKQGGFDLVLNLYSSVAHLPDLAEVERHLKRVRELMTPDGLFLLGLTVHEAGVALIPDESLYQMPATKIPGGGSAAVHYSSAGINPNTGREIINILLLTRDVPGVPEMVQDSYELMLFAKAELEALLARTGFSVLAVHSMSTPGYPASSAGLTPGAGDVTLILRPSVG